MTRSLWPGVLLAPIAWAANGLFAWGISAQACLDGRPDWGPLPPAGVRAAIAMLAVLAFVAAAAGLASASRARRGTAASRSVAAINGEETREYLAIAGVLVSVAFMFGIALNALPAVMVGLCVDWR